MNNGESSYRRFLDGDESAFDEILKEYRNSLTFFIDRYVHDIDAAEDIAIDVFTEVIVHPHRYNFKTTLKTYLFMIGRSRALDYIKHKKKIIFSELEEADKLVDEHSSLEEIVLADERKHILNMAIAKLPENMELVVHLVYFENLSYEETAKVMKKNVKQIDNLLYRAKKELRSILGKEGELLI